MQDKSHNGQLWICCEYYADQNNEEVGINVGDLFRSKIMIQGINQKGQRVIGMIRLKLQIGELISSALFHVIDVKTSYELPFQCVWLHETGVVPLTWHQCFKYGQDGEVKCVVAEIKPFLEEESHFADAKFYMEYEGCNFVGLPCLDSKSKKMQMIMICLVLLNLINLSKASQNLHPKDSLKVKKPQIESTDIEVLRKELTLPIPSIPKFSSKQEGAPESKLTFKGCYNPQVKKLFENVEFGKGEPRRLGDLDVVLHEDVYGLGYNPNPPRKIKVKKVSSNPIMVQIYEVAEEKSEQPRPSSFDRIENENVRVSVFKRNVQAPQMSSQRQSAFSRLGIKTSDPSNEDEEEVSVNHIAFEETLDSDSESESDEPEPAPPTFEEGGKATTEEDPRPVFVSALLSQNEEFEYPSLLQEYKDVFAWPYKKMSGLDPKVAVHHLAVRHGVQPVKQPQRKFRPERISQIEVENGQFRICVDFRDLNQACPKDDYPLLITKLMVDATIGYEVLSFMDGFFGYN
ncbi:uncharacterized protein LOC111371101 [Olea europaea var. sylvestris]|uniref:uncharacterized protein LOC111371101 n=1 Tax=Olea europaea var. sylvestris TaxID=158386 RepID=UPI000C1D2172|nr:uncharacterized protein LOC111371101 [Olea europaea var. sylvestris]